MELIYRINIPSQELFEKYPSVWRDEYKKKIFKISCPEACSHCGALEITRWKAKTIPAKFDLGTVSTKIITHDGPFGYPPPTDSNSVIWHLNFADGDLFFHYGSSLMAQDEHQVAEHPILASVKEMLDILSEGNEDYAPCTRDFTHLTPNPPTPVLIMGAERRLVIDLSPNEEQERPAGLYGNLFREAPWEVIEKAMSVVSPPTLSNIIAMEAPSGGKGVYTLEQITDAFQTAFTAFLAAREESEKRNGKGTKVIINTGNWGTGAYGGNKVLMASIQLLAAMTIQIDRVHYYTSESDAVEKAQSLVGNLVQGKATMTVQDSLFELFEMGFQWGVSDGN